MSTTASKVPVEAIAGSNGRAQIEVNPIVAANNKSKGGRPYFFDDPQVERVLSITMAVVGELAVARERLDTLERLLESKGVLSRDEIESFMPDEAAAEQRQRWHAEYIARVLRIVQQEFEALRDPEGSRDLEDIADELGRT